MTSASMHMWGHGPGQLHAGAAKADAALLVVDGSIGGFESGFNTAAAGGGGQTREHAQLARCLGVESLVVVITKLDTCGFKQARPACLFPHARALYTSGTPGMQLDAVHHHHRSHLSRARKQHPVAMYV